MNSGPGTVSIHVLFEQIPPRFLVNDAVVKYFQENKVVDADKKKV